MKHVSMNNVIKCKACENPFISDIAVCVLCKYWFHLIRCNMSDDELHSLLENCTVYVCSNCQHTNNDRLPDLTPSINQHLPLNFSNSSNQEDEMELWSVDQFRLLIFCCDDHA